LDELRWILLVLGVLAIGAIWLWSARGSRQAPGNAELREPTVSHPHGAGAVPPGGANHGDPPLEPASFEARPAAADRREWGVPPLEPLSIRTADFAEVPALDQPMLTHADPVDFSLDSSRATGQARFGRTQTAARSAQVPVIEFEPVPLDDEPLDDVHGDATVEIEIAGHSGEELEAEAQAAGEVEARAEVAHAEAQAAAEAEARAEEQAREEERAREEEQAREEERARAEEQARAASARRGQEHSDRHAAVAPQPANRSEKQKIVTVRVCAVGETRWAGAELMSALEALGLAFGRYQVYHRKHNDGRSIFCVASLVEPGTFNLAAMPDEEFRGVSLFAVLPGPLEPMQTVETLLATARELARALSGTMQDGKGIPLSPQRTEALLQDVARFQALLA
jgi:cell division protein ZipA